MGSLPWSRWGRSPTPPTTPWPDCRPARSSNCTAPPATSCAQCADRTTLDDALGRIDAGETDPACQICGGILRTATIMFGEALDPGVLSEAAAIAGACTVMFAVGTSLEVYPAAGLVPVAASTGARLVIVNAEPTPYDDIAAEVVREPIGTALPRLLRDLAP